MSVPTRYARNGDVNLAYQVHGDGPVDLLFLSAYINHVEHVWENPGFARFLTRLMQFSRLIIWDRRGSGLSDMGPVGIEHEVGDINAVLDAAGSERAAVLAYNAGGPLAALMHQRAGSWVPVFGTAIMLDVLTALFAIALLKPMRRRFLAARRPV